jgi:hypothetical protein
MTGSPTDPSRHVPRRLLTRRSTCPRGNGVGDLPIGREASAVDAPHDAVMIGRIRCADHVSGRDAGVNSQCHVREDCIG